MACQCKCALCYLLEYSLIGRQCCSPQFNGGGGWGIFNALFGWTNSATYGTVLSYNLYWIAVSVGFLALMYYEKKGHWPLQSPKSASDLNDRDAVESMGSDDVENGRASQRTEI